ncbi:MAG: helix-hairpin-helix domain-containing protein [Verrucomicrobiota bacterium]
MRILNPQFKPMQRQAEGGSVLIIVLWVALGLVTIAIYFANSMSFELHASDNSLAASEANQAIDGAARYVSYVLANQSTPGAVPDPLTYQSEAVPIGDARFWIIGRATNSYILRTDRPSFGLVDEASKLNLNTATSEMLQALPGMTADLAAAIIDWRDSDETPTDGGAESDIYLRRQPGYQAKNANFETLDELRLLQGGEWNILYGEDANLNGVLDLNENDADQSPPSDNKNGRLDAGILEYVTVYSRESNLRSDGSAKINVTNADNREQLRTLLEQKLGSAKATQIVNALNGPAVTVQTNLLGFYLQLKNAAQVTAEDFAQFESDISFSDQPVEGLVNVNTASEAVLACIPGIGTDHASSIVAYRQGNAGNLQSIGWVAEVLTEAENQQQAAPYLTTHSYQFTADIAAVGHFGRGYQRVKFVFDTSEGSPKIRYRRDLSPLGWALGQYTRDWLLAQKENNL